MEGYNANPTSPYGVEDGAWCIVRPCRIVQNEDGNTGPGPFAEGIGEPASYVVPSEVIRLQKYKVSGSTDGIQHPRIGFPAVLEQVHRVAGDGRGHPNAKSLGYGYSHPFSF